MKFKNFIEVPVWYDKPPENEELQALGIEEDSAGEETSITSIAPEDVCFFVEATRKNCTLVFVMGMRLEVDKPYPEFKKLMEQNVTYIKEEV